MTALLVSICDACATAAQAPRGDRPRLFSCDGCGRLACVETLRVGDDHHRRCAECPDTRLREGWDA